jgi:hypothetical protein
LVNELIQSGMLAAPFKQSIVGSRSYFVIASPLAAGKPYVREFTAWLIDEVKRDAERDGQG